MRTIESLDGWADTVATPRFDVARPARIVVAGAAVAPQPRPLLCGEADFVDPWLPAYHRTPRRAVARDISCYFVAGAGISGPGHIVVGDALITAPEFMPGYWRRMALARDGIDPQAEQHLPARVIEEPCLCFLGHGLNVYGHLLLEMLPRLHVALRVLRERLPPHRILLERQTPRWLLAILRDVYDCRDADFVFFDRGTERVVLAQAILPTLASTEGHFHPHAAAFYRALVAAAGSARLDAGRLFISRAFFRHSHSYPRRCVNELELAEIAAQEFGFTPLAPETFGWRDQIRLFAGARVVLGEYGSGLHGALFSPAGTRVAALGYLNLEQSHVGELCGHWNAYLRVDPTGQGMDYSVDPQLFRRFLTQLLQTEPAAVA